MNIGDATDATGGGGGQTTDSSTGPIAGNGGSGIVMFRYQYQGS